MTKPTFGDLFQGFGGATIGAMQAGCRPLWGVEYKPEIAAVAVENLGHPIIMGDIRDLDVEVLTNVDVLHASPPCPNFSTAKHGTESENDMALAQKVADTIYWLAPSVFTLENVWAYRKSRSWDIIRDMLEDMGYMFSVDHINAADYGVPQSRKRMWVRAVRGRLLPPLPLKEPLTYGWYKAVEDLLPELERCELAPWQLRGLKPELRNMLIDSAGYPDSEGTRVPVTRYADEPANTIVANHASRGMKAFLVTGQYALPAGSGQRPVQARPDDQPANTVVASSSKDWRAVLGQGEIARFNSRCLARLQTFPDWYLLPKKKTLACYGIGNAVPPLLYKQILSQLVEAS